MEESKLIRCVEAARLAPSWANRQCWHFVLVQGKQEVDDLGVVPAGVKNTPALIVACGDPGKSGRLDDKPYYLVDVGIAAEHIVLAAWEQGLGTVWIGAIKEDKIRKALGIPPEIKVVALIPIGYPSDRDSLTLRLTHKAAGSVDRKDIKEILHKGRW